MLSRADRAASRPPRQTAAGFARIGLLVAFAIAALVAVSAVSLHALSSGAAPQSAARSPVTTESTELRQPSARRLRLLGAERPIYRFASYLVDNLAQKTYRTDPVYFNGAFQSPEKLCWMCNTGPGAAAAVLATFGGPRASYYRRLAIRTFSDAIHARQRVDGSFLNPALPSQGSGIPTLFFGVELGEAYVEMGPTLSPATRRLWRDTLGRAARVLLGQGLLTHYVNGNINLQFTELLWDAWHATGDSALHRDYETSWAFTMSPGPSWRGFGLITTKHGNGPHGSTSSGYLTESSGGSPGFDPDYTQLQADEAARLYVLSHDGRALLLMNLLTNQLRPLSTPGFLLNTSGGTRHPQADRFVPFTDSAVPVLSWLRGRTDLLPDVPNQFRELRQVLCQNLVFPYAPLYRAMGNELSVLLLATQAAGDRASAAGLGARYMCPGLPPSLRARLVP